MSDNDNEDYIDEEDYIDNEDEDYDDENRYEFEYLEDDILTDLQEDATDPDISNYLLETYGVLYDVYYESNRIIFNDDNKQYIIFISDQNRNNCNVKELRGSLSNEEISIGLILGKCMNMDIKKYFNDIFSNYTREDNKMMESQSVIHIDVKRDAEKNYELLGGRILYNKKKNIILRLWDLILLIKDCIPNHCIICSRYIGHKGICTSEICIYNYLDNTQFNRIEEILFGPERDILNMLYNLALCTLRSSRVNYLFYPVPEEYQLSGDIDYKRMYQVLIEKSWNDIIIMNKEKIMEQKHTPFFSLLWWVYARQTIYCSFTRVDNNALGYNNKIMYQIVRYKDPIIDGQNAYHGSPCENWLSILTNGMLNLSGTRHMLTGAVYGKGVYLSPQYSVSYRYSSGYPRIVALVSLSNEYKANPHFVINEPNKIQLKYLIMDS